MKTKIHEKNKYCAGPNCDCGFVPEVAIMKTTQKEAQHTPTGLDVDTLALIDRIKNEPTFREFSIRAVNNHESLLETLKNCRHHIENSPHPNNWAIMQEAQIKEIDKAISQAEAQP